MTTLHPDLEALMPEPSHKSLYTREPVYTATQMREAILAATDRAATICDGLVYALDNGGNRYRREADASKCAAAIRRTT